MIVAIPKVSLNTKKVVDLSARTPLFPYEKFVGKIQVHKVFLHDTTVGDDGKFNSYGSASYRARITVLDSNNPNIRAGKDYQLMFGVFEKGFKGEKAAGKLRQLLASVADDAGSSFDADVFLETILDTDLDDAKILFSRAERSSEMDDGSTKTFTDVDSFSAA